MCARLWYRDAASSHTDEGRTDRVVDRFYYNSRGEGPQSLLRAFSAWRHEQQMTVAGVGVAPNFSKPVSHYLRHALAILEVGKPVRAFLRIHPDTVDLDGFARIYVTRKYPEQYAPYHRDSDRCFCGKVGPGWMFLSADAMLTPSETNFIGENCHRDSLPAELRS